ncbi:ExbD/TolR family protein [Hwangdonia lutea]|uniref:Biopolymer transporter ExbD n=1 Tax=Hwangdonia lutea TaxID=3075823 RepID=A0AA97HQ26_9FLAO|nr:biopolymer transporter ExbD [Hwangdonia sp. SCSIO 19198]WOD43277.1 biopolymer transporter ExbD [Hwangdonia sp. SCSIO 19198]
MRHSKLIPEVNAGSMADIAFLLLIFFLVTATIPKDKGINRMLPKYSEIPTNVPINERNILRIMINNNNEIMLENELIALEDLKEATKNFIDNNGDASCNYCNGAQSENASDHPKKAVVSLQTGKQTSYQQFIAVQDELTKAYFELRQIYSQNILKKEVDNLSKTDLKKVKEAYPFILSEALTK